MGIIILKSIIKIYKMGNFIYFSKKKIIPYEYKPICYNCKKELDEINRVLKYKETSIYFCDIKCEMIK